MVARTRKTNSAAHSVHVGKPSARAPDDGASTSTSRRRAGSASSSRGTRVSELQGMLANLTDMVTGLTAQQAVILRQTQLVCAVLPLPAPCPPVPAVPAPPPVAAIPEMIPAPAAAPAPVLPIPAVGSSICAPPSPGTLSLRCFLGPPHPTSTVTKITPYSFLPCLLWSPSSSLYMGKIQ
ncbi:hypothetical protein AXF42_Ash002565 [Apostasia shenzhenica]|uniref:Uncharacterized protein n=1 Tax=Apostasia shenzhenica TaxID=1088818 RepID=A0A2I0ANX0_9ASPA|nr:hypothetical protein AXF42_Ash002565 [Apostasia shenzhenica]